MFLRVDWVDGYLEVGLTFEKRVGCLGDVCGSCGVCGTWVRIACEEYRRSICES